MNTKVKKVIAKEFLILLVATVIGAIGFLYGYVATNNHWNELDKIKSLNDNLNREIESRITDFRKDPIVDSVYNIQISFFDDYEKISGKYGSDSSNFFFWRNILSTIADSTFDFTYANDNVMSNMWGNYVAREILAKHRNKIHDSEEFYPIKKKLFSSFVQNIQLYNFISHDKWVSYEKLRVEQDRVKSEIPKLENENYTKPDEGFVFGFGASVILLFGVRYLVYLVKWAIRTWKSS
jgi:hypothetical protein